MVEFEFETYTLSQLSSLTGIATSTLSDYRNRFGDYIPTKGSGRNRRYTKEAIPVFKFIKSKFEEGLRKEQIDELLDKNFPRQVDIPEEYEVYEDVSDSSPATDVIPGNSEAMSLIVGTIQDLKNEIVLLREEAAEDRRKLKEEISFLRQELEKATGETSENLRSVGKQINTSISAINNTTEKTSESIRKAGDEIKSEISAWKEDILKEVNEAYAAVNIVRADTEKRDREVLEAIRGLQEKQNQSKPWWKKLLGR